MTVKELVEALQKYYDEDAEVKFVSYGNNPDDVFDVDEVEPYGDNAVLLM